MECGCSDTSDEACSTKKIRSSDDEDELDANSMDANFENSVCTDEAPSDVETESIHEREVDAPPLTPVAAPFQTSSSTFRADTVHCQLGTPCAPTSVFQGTLTSTPAPVRLTNDVLTPSPFSCSNDDMSPITMSAQKMPKSMQVSSKSLSLTR